MVTFFWQQFSTGGLPSSRKTNKWLKHLRNFRSMINADATFHNFTDELGLMGMEGGQQPAPSPWPGMRHSLAGCRGYGGWDEGDKSYEMRGSA